LSRDCGFGYAEMMAMPTHILLGLWSAKRGVLEEEAEEQKKQQQSQSAGGQQAPSMSSMMSQAKGMMPKTPSMPSVRMPG